MKPLLRHLRDPRCTSGTSERAAFRVARVVHFLAVSAAGALFSGDSGEAPGAGDAVLAGCSVPSSFSRSTVSLLRTTMLMRRLLGSVRFFWSSGTEPAS